MKMFYTHWQSILIVCGYGTLIGVRSLGIASTASLGLLYLLLISLAGFWYGVRGGFLAAAVASLILMVDILWCSVEVPHGWDIQIGVYVVQGILLGFLRDRDSKKQRETPSSDFLQSLAYQDDLTGCINYRWLMQSIEKETALSCRYGKPMALVMADIDQLKLINDRYGHLVGNDVLRFFSAYLMRNVRAVDVVGRYGGDEFAVILHETDAEQAAILMERIRVLLRNSRVRSAQLHDPDGLMVKFSAGIVSFPRHGSTAHEILDAADHALYQAKRMGRDQLFIEQRQRVRYAPQPELTVELIATSEGNGIHAVAIENISQQGGLVVVDQNTVPSGEYWCRIRLAARSLADIRCRIVRSVSTDAGRCAVGVSFLEMPFTQVQQAIL